MSTRRGTTTHRPRPLPRRHPSQRESLQRIGSVIRARRIEAGLTQAALGKRAGIVAKYVSEIERGNRDVPFSTLQAIVERGLGLVLEMRMLPAGSRLAPAAPAFAPELFAVARLTPAKRRAVVAIVRGALALAR